MMLELARQQWKNEIPKELCSDRHMWGIWDDGGRSDVEFARACTMIIPKIRASRERFTPPVLLIRFLAHIQTIIAPIKAIASSLLQEQQINQ